METWHEFRVQVAAETDHGWRIEVRQCSLSGLIGRCAVVEPRVTRKDVNVLRRNSEWSSSADLGRLIAIGYRVWESVMPSPVADAFEACLSVLPEDGVLHLTYVLDNGATGGACEGAVRPSEVPVEALFTDRLGFVGSRTATPISRSMLVASDGDPVQLDYPARMLALAAPKSGSGADAMRGEMDALQEVVDQYQPAGAEPWTIQESLTKRALFQLLTAPGRSSQLLHFMGHGGFGTSAGDPTPQGYLALANAERLYAHDFATFLHDTPVKVVVLTACSTALAPDENDESTAGAFADVARRLAVSDANLACVVGMQYDLEADVAPAFTQALYSAFLGSGVPLDVALTQARKAIISQRNQGHRSWIAPVIYWRRSCICQPAPADGDEREPFPQVDACEDLSLDDRLVLVDLLLRSGHVQDGSARRALLNRLGVDPNVIETQGRASDFAVACISHLCDTGDRAAMLRLCDVLAAVLRGSLAARVAAIKAKLEGR